VLGPTDPERLDYRPEALGLSPGSSALHARGRIVSIRSVAAEQRSTPPRAAPPVGRDRHHAPRRRLIKSRLTDRFGPHRKDYRVIGELRRSRRGKLAKETRSSPSGGHWSRRCSADLERRRGRQRRRRVLFSTTIRRQDEASRPVVKRGSSPSSSGPPRSHRTRPRRHRVLISFEEPTQACVPKR